jgi:hypothetical protein
MCIYGVHDIVFCKQEKRGRSQQRKLITNLQQINWAQVIVVEPKHPNNQMTAARTASWESWRQHQISRSLCTHIVVCWILVRLSPHLLLVCRRSCPHCSSLVLCWLMHWRVVSAATQLSSTSYHAIGWIHPSLFSWTKWFRRLTGMVRTWNMLPRYGCRAT